MKSLQDLIIKTEKVDWKKLKPFQPDGLKRVSRKQIDKLKNSLIKNGFLMAFYAFELDGSIWFADGHIRYKALHELIEEGHAVPEFLTCSLLDIKSQSQARRVVMAFNSHYAEIDKEELLDWIEGEDLDELKEMFDIDFSFDPGMPKEKRSKTCPHCGEEI